MPVQFFTTSQRENLNRFPQNIEHNDVITYFTLSERDLAEIPIYSHAANRLGFALQLGALRFMGFFPTPLQSAPSGVVSYVANQIGVEPTVLLEYGQRVHTVSDHQRKISAYLNYRKADDKDWQQLSAWLLERALEHDRPSLLYNLTCEKLRDEKIIRPGMTRLERLIAEVRHQAQAEIMRRIEPILTQSCGATFDRLLEVDSHSPLTLLSWLRRPAITNSPSAIVSNLKKLAFLKEMEVEEWNLGNLNPNCIKRLATIARRATAQTLQRAPSQRRYSTLVAFVYQSLIDITDETIDMFIRCLAETNNRAKTELEQYQKSIATATNEKVLLFSQLGRIVLDETISDAELRGAIFKRIPKKVLQRAVYESTTIARPLDDSHVDFFERRYSYLRQFIPKFLNTFNFQSNPEADSLLNAVNILRTLNSENRRKIPDEAPIDFIPNQWRPYVISKNGAINRHYYELCVLWELRGALRAGNIWLKHSRKFANPETYLIPPNRWLHQMQSSKTVGF